MEDIAQIIKTRNQKLFVQQQSGLIDRRPILEVKPSTEPKQQPQRRMPPRRSH